MAARKEIEAVRLRRDFLFQSEASHGVFFLSWSQTLIGRSDQPDFASPQLQPERFPPTAQREDAMC